VAQRFSAAFNIFFFKFFLSTETFSPSLTPFEWRFNMQFREVIIAHELDAAWIIALWKAIHGGDGGPEQIAAQAIAALAQYVAGPAPAAFTFDALHARFAKLGVQVTEKVAEPANTGAKPDVEAAIAIKGSKPIHQYCFKFEGETICIKLPLLTHLPTAA
jgi:hypothetical protein